MNTVECCKRSNSERTEKKVKERKRFPAREDAFPFSLFPACLIYFVIKLMNRVLSSNRRRSLPRPELANPVTVLSLSLFAPSSLRSAHQQDMAQISTLFVPRINKAGILSLSLAAHLRWLLSPTSLRVAKALFLETELRRSVARHSADDQTPFRD